MNISYSDISAIILLLTAALLLFLVFRRIMFIKIVQKYVKMNNMKQIGVELLNSSKDMHTAMTGQFTLGKLYMSRDVIVISPKSDYSYHSLLGWLPLVIPNTNSCNTKEFKKIKLVNPKRIKITDWGLINIDYTEETGIWKERSIGITLSEKEQIKTLRELSIESWCKSTENIRYGL